MPYVFFFNELGSGRVYFAGFTASPDSAWVTLQARQQVWNYIDEYVPVRFLIHDSDTKFSPRFDSIFVSEDVSHPDPFRVPQANAIAKC